MNIKILHLILLLSSLIGYLEWGSDNHMFLIEGEIDILSKLFTDPLSVIHPLIILPLIGQLLLLYTLFQSTPGKVLTYIGVSCIGLLFLVILLTGILGKNFKVTLSTIPFIVTAIFVIRYHMKNRESEAI